MGQVANCQYVCSAINAYASRNYTPATGTASQVANVEYLMKMIDKATRDITGGGTAASNYQATYTSKQAVDATGVNSVLALIKWKVTAPGSITNGSITANYTYAKYGQSVTVTISPSSGYELNTISATGATLSGSGTTRTFTMSKSNVTITGSFKAIFVTQTWSTPGSYSCNLPVGTFKMTAVSGKGGNGGSNNLDVAGSSGTQGQKGEKTFTQAAAATVTVIVGGNGGNGENGTTTNNGGAGGSGGTYGNGGNGVKGSFGQNTSSARSMMSPPNSVSGGGGGGGGASGISTLYYVKGGNGGKGADISTSNDYTVTGTVAGGAAGQGGTLSGTVVNGTATSESSSVKIELA
jgi:hypothetical protein